MFHGISNEEINITLNTFQSDYTDFNYNNGPYYDNNFIWNSK